MPVPSLNQWSVIDFYPSWVVPLGSGDNCYDPTLITNSKTSHIQSISVLLGLKNSWRSRR